jgi:4-hydroxy-3-methylbut-2-en-1-yl diphosphate reductase
MPRNFETPSSFLSPTIGRIKTERKSQEGRKKSRDPFIFELSSLTLKLARHFGFCYGVENAVDIAYRALEEREDKRVFLLSQMIHNSFVNDDLLKKGIRFLRTTSGEQLIPFEELTQDDIVILPAFGVSLDIIAKLEERGIDALKYNATCPFVEKVWRRAGEIGQKGYSIILHGKHYHEETRATFSYAENSAPTLIIRDKNDAEVLCEVILGNLSPQIVFERFEGKFTADFEPEKHLFKLGVVNQTTMLAYETREIAEMLKNALIKRFGADNIRDHFADTRDTLCYATAENQDAIEGLLADGGDAAVVVGGFNSSNTSHLAKLCNRDVPAFHIETATDIVSKNEIRHRLFSGEIVTTTDWFPQSFQGEKPVILVSAGASTPDKLVEETLAKLSDIWGCKEEFAESFTGGA